MRPRVFVESPLAGDTATNVAYAKACLRHSLALGEAPFASHLLYPLVLDDGDPTERALGIEVGFDWARSAELTVVYVDLGISSGMKAGVKDAQAMKRPVEYRSIGAFDRVFDDDSAAAQLALMKKRAYDAECDIVARDTTIAELSAERDVLAVVMLGFLEAVREAAGVREMPPFPPDLAEAYAIAERVARPLIRASISGGDA